MPRRGQRRAAEELASAFVPDAQLLNAEGNLPHDVAERREEQVAAGMGKVLELPELLDNAHVGGADALAAVPHSEVLA